MDQTFTDVADPLTHEWKRLVSGAGATDIERAATLGTSERTVRYYKSGHVPEIIRRLYTRNLIRFQSPTPPTPTTEATNAAL